MCWAAVVVEPEPMTNAVTHGQDEGILDINVNIFVLFLKTKYKGILMKALNVHATM